MEKKRVYFGIEYFRGACGYWNAEVGRSWLIADSVAGIKSLIKKKVKG